MTISPRIAGLGLICGLVAACARRPQMGVVDQDARSIRPRDGAALVLFLRPSQYAGKAVGSSIWDGDRFLGLMTNNTVLAYQATPGVHRFGLLMGTPAQPAFLNATLGPGLTYYVRIELRSKWTAPILDRKSVV